MNISLSLPSSVDKISFSFLTSDDVRKISVKQIVNPVLLDGLNRPNIGGLYDPELGPIDQQDICGTCRLTFFTCPGHFGHIELPAPVFHPLFMVNMYNLLRGVCLFCHRFKIDRALLCRFIAKLRLLDYGLLDASQGVDEFQRYRKPTQPKQPKAKKKGRKDEGDESQDGVEMEGVDDVLSGEEKKDETLQAYMARLNLYVFVHLSRAKGSKRDDYKDGLVYQARRDLINEFLKATIMRKCQNDECRSPAFTFRKEGHTKIIEYDLSPKQKRQLLRRRPLVLLDEKMRSLEQQEVGEDEDVAMTGPSDEEGEGDDLEGDDDDEKEEEVHPDGNATKGAPDLPRAANGRVKTKRGRNERVMTPEECRAHLRRLFRNEATMCSLIFGKHGPFATVRSDATSPVSADMFFLDVLAVTPSRFRPAKKLGEVLFEHSQNELLSKIISTSYRLRDINVDLRAAQEKTSELDDATRKRIQSSLLGGLIQLQIDVNSFMDASKNPSPMRQGQLPPPGVKQGLEKKEGLFRKNMMGKRVNYAARSVISPDINIEPNEIGVPPVFARKLTFPEPVTPANFHELRQQVIAGPRGYPGASMVEYEDGHQQSLDKLSIEQRTAIANQLLTPQDGDNSGFLRGGLSTRTPAVNKKVYRHLRDGDVLILNRQPTLHKPSMMAHKARVLQGEKTIRMHYANCNSYNADFDGDEMNIHFPQNQVARAEAMMIANTDNQYLVPTSGNPLRGLIQDHVVAGVWMTTQDAFFTREEYFQLLYGALRPEDDGHDGQRLLTLPPAIWKPRPLWTGKQIISTVLKNITPDNVRGLNLTSKTKVPGALWSYEYESFYKGSGAKEKNDKVIIMDGELIYGVLDKSSFGASDYGLVHSIYELYGSAIAGKLLGILSRLFTKFLQHRAFTCRMDDLMLNPDGDHVRRSLFEEARGLGTTGAIENFPSLSNVPSKDIPTALTSLLQDVLRDDEKMAGLDMTVKTKLNKLTNSVTERCMPNGLLRKFPQNNMQTMTQSGAKGSAVNARQISCALGQQELEGRRVPVMVSGKTLPSFKPFETKAIAGGYVASRFLTGIKPQEFYFHCMAGREGLIDTAVKTSRSGYLQRCLIKHLEGIRIHYDNTVRGSDASIYQFMYGGDGLDVTKQKHLRQFDFIARNEVSLVNHLRPQDVIQAVDDKHALDYMKKTLKRSKVPPNPWSRSRREKYDPTLSVYNPARFLGSTSEQFAEAVADYVVSNPRGLIANELEEKFTRSQDLITSKHFRLLMNMKYMRSLVEPGEAVGLLASQGIGEPSTQMTLNTFHFAGHGAANVTLGIPRLREIVMTASSKPKTPSMTMKVRRGVSPEAVKIFCKQASRLTLSQLVENVSVVEKLVIVGDARRIDRTVQLVLFPKDEYVTEYDVEPEEILACFGTRFPLILKKEIAAELKKLDQTLKSQIAELGKGMKARNDIDGGEASEVVGENDDDEPSGKTGGAREGSENGDGDADDIKRSKQRKQQATYDDDEDDGGDEEVEDDAEEEQDAASDEEEGSSSHTSKRRSKKDLDAAISRVAELFEKNMPLGEGFSFSDSASSFTLSFSSSMPKLLLVGIIERVCRATVIREIPGIKDCFHTTDEKSKVITINTNGSNFQGLWHFTASAGDEQLLEEDSLYSNDIYAILKTYGVEAARASILREVGGVFAVYSIQVDHRHLELIADYMTFDGSYKPFSRRGISSNSSPLLKASYETTAAFLSDATLYGDFDDLSTPSGSIILGRPNRTGTGVFDVVMGVGAS